MSTTLLTTSLGRMSTTIGHVPYNLAPYLSRFLARDVNKAFAEVTGEKVNRRAGYGLEIPCVYRLYGPKAYVDKMKVITDSMMSSGLINPRRACAARVTVLVLCVCLSVCLSVSNYSRTTGYEAAYERYQQLQCYKGKKNNVAILLKRLRSRDMA